MLFADPRYLLHVALNTGVVFDFVVLVVFIRKGERIVLSGYPVASDLIQNHVVNQITLRRKIAKVKLVLLRGLRTKLLHAEWLLFIHIVVLERTDQRPLNLLQLDL